MADKLWKAFERWVGKNLFNGSPRNLGSGAINKTDKGEDRPGDVVHPLYMIECKLRNKIAIFRWWEKLLSEAKQVNKIPVLVMREEGNAKTVLVTIDWKWFVELKELWEEKNGHNKTSESK